MKVTLFAGMAAVVAALSGCTTTAGSEIGLFSATAPVIAILDGDLFIGKAVGYMDRSGTINLVSAVNKDLQCVGSFHYTGSKIGEGKMACNDGAEARFQFNGLSMVSGYGYGNSSRGGFSFTFGLTAEEAEPYLKLPAGRKIKKNAQGKPEMSNI